MKTTLIVAVLALGFVASVRPALAHHSVSAEYDIATEIAMYGVVTRIEWMNPHARLWMDATNDDGTVSAWELELPPPNALKRMAGNLDFIRQGDRVGVNLWRAKDGSRLAHTLSLTTPAGRVMKFPSGNWERR